MKGASGGCIIRPLLPSDGSTWATLRMLGEHPEAFGSSYEESAARGVEVLAKEFVERIESGSTRVFGAIEEERLVGAAGLFCPPGPKVRHKAMLWGMYVAPESRGMGIGQALVEAVRDAAIGTEGVEQLQLSVVTVNPGAQRLYERCGFAAYALEKDALRLSDGRHIDELHMVSWLRREQLG